LHGSPGQIAELRHALGVDRPLPVQYWDWLRNLLLHGSLGNSIANGEPVTHALGPRVLVTLSLVVSATLLATFLGVAIGVISSRGGRVSGTIADAGSVIGAAVPSFWFALLLIMLFSVRLGWLPSYGYVPLQTSPSEWAKSLALPVIALAFGGMTAVAKQTRAAMLDVYGRDFVRNLRANGIPERSIVLKHALRSAAIPVVTISGLLFVGAISGAVVMEQIFGLPGLGSIAINSIALHDIPVIQGVAIYFAVLVSGMNLVVDLAYAWLDPRVRSW
jgi:peptide/nickel transport system permease protein